MAYRKMLVDNVTCKRRFHVTFDDEASQTGPVELKCPHCDTIVFSSPDHPPVRLGREENLIKTTELAEHVVESCSFKDSLTYRTAPHLQGKSAQPMYPDSLPGRPGTK